MGRATNTKLEWLKGMLEKVRPAGKGWIARCPAHDDNQQSLSLAVGRNGHVLLNCFKGCDKHKIVEALGIELADLFENVPLSDMNDKEKSELHQAFAQAKWATAVDTMRRESVFLDLCSRALANGETLDTESQLRLSRSVKFLDEAFTTLTTGPGRPRGEKLKLPSEILDRYEKELPKKSGWSDDDEVPRPRGRGTSQPRTAPRQGRSVPVRRKPLE